MAIISKIKFGEDEYIYPVIFNYFHPFLVRFGAKNEIDYLTTDTFELKEIHLKKFAVVVKFALVELLEECYQEPSHKNRSKHPGRFEKIYVDDVKYVVDYRKDYIGKILYGLNYLLNWTTKHIASGSAEEE